jgi:hypothetical protein
MPALQEPKTIAGLFLIVFPLVMVAYLMLYSLSSCTNCAPQSQLWILVPTTDPVSTIIFASMITGLWLLVFGLKSIRIPLLITKMFVTGIGFLVLGTIFMAWALNFFMAYQRFLEHPYHLCDVCDPTMGYGAWALLGGILGSVGVSLLLMNWKRKVLHAHGYI